MAESKLIKVDGHYQAEVVPGKSITVFKDGVIGASFGIGDEAEYDSYNLSYIGVITGITEKRVRITAYKGSCNERVHSLDLYKFSWRNFNFDAAKAHAKNVEESYYI